MSTSTGQRFFEDTEIVSSNPEAVRAEGGRINERLNNREGAYSGMINRIVRPDIWADAYRGWQSLHAEWHGPLQEDWSRAQSSGDRTLTLQSLRRREERLLAFEAKFRDHLIQAEHGLPTQAAAEFAATRVLKMLQPELDKRLDAIDKATLALGAIKKEIDAAKSFGEHVRDLRKASATQALWWTVAIVGVLAGGAYTEWALRLPETMPWYNTLFLRLSILLPLTYMVYFFFGQYKLARLTNIKYRHVEGLLSGGASAVVALFEGREEFKHRVHEKLADQLMSVDDLIGALAGSSTPVEEAVKLIKSTGEAVEQVKRLR